jgi:hypothetical protein
MEMQRERERERERERSSTTRKGGHSRCCRRKKRRRRRRRCRWYKREEVGRKRDEGGQCSTGRGKGEDRTRGGEGVLPAFKTSRRGTDPL